MSEKSSTSKLPAVAVVRYIRRATRRHYSAEDKIRIVLEGLRGEQSIAELCRREGIADSMYYSWSKEFLEAGKRRLAGDCSLRSMRVPDFKASDFPIPKDENFDRTIFKRN
jgi:transposase